MKVTKRKPFGPGELTKRIRANQQSESIDEPYIVQCPSLSAAVAEPVGAQPSPCADCDEAAKLAYSDATTPGFFEPKCAKHRDLTVWEKACDYCRIDGRPEKHSDGKWMHYYEHEEPSECLAGAVAEAYAAHLRSSSGDVAERLMHCPGDSPGVTHHEGPDCAKTGCTPVSADVAERAARRIYDLIGRVNIPTYGEVAAIIREEMERDKLW